MKYLVVLLAFIGLVGCSDVEYQAVSETATTLKFVKRLELPLTSNRITVYKSTVSSNCYVMYGAHRGGFSQVACEDFLPKQESEKEVYERLKEKYQ